MPVSPLELFDIVYITGPEAELFPFAMVSVAESSRAILASKERIRQAGKRSPIVGVAVRDKESGTVTVWASNPAYSFPLAVFAKLTFST